MSSDPDRLPHGRSAADKSDNGGARPAPGRAIGAALATAREARGLSIEDVAATTRIRAALVAAIERDDFSGCGGAFYARAHLRTIARVVDADADALVAEFDRREGPVTPAAEDLTTTTLRPPPAGATRRHSARWAVAAVVVLVVLAAVLVGRWATQRGSGDASGTDAAPTTPAASATPKPTPTAPATTPPPTTPPPATGVSLLLQDLGPRSWLSVTSSAGALVYAGVLESGATLRFNDPTMLTVRFGNAQGVLASLNGKAATAPCPQTVCTVNFTRSAVTPG